MSQIGLKGGKELLAFLDAFPKNMQKNAVRAGLTAAARPIRDQARGNVRRKTGKLAKSIKSSSPRVNTDGTVSIKVQLKGPHAYLGNWIEYGVAAHIITAGDSGKSARLLTRQVNRDGARQDEESGAMIIGNNYVRGAVLHPGIAPMPFMRPALDSKAQDAINAFGKRIQEYLKSKTAFTSPALEVDDE